MHSFNFQEISMKKILYILLGVMALSVMSCNDIEEKDRYIYVKPAEKGRKVLVEDYTGQNCPNCPEATDEIHKLMKQYGGDTLIAVAIHSGPMGLKGKRGLATELGNTYYNYFKFDSQPVGMVNRHGKLKFADWAGAVYNEVQTKAPLDLDLVTAYDAEKGSVDVTVNTRGTRGTTEGKLQLWVLEDSIVARQSLKGGAVDNKYVHNHVLRAAVNGDWGTAYKIAEGESTSEKFHYDLNKKWKPAHLSIVAFVYNDGGVQQVNKAVVMKAPTAPQK